MLTEHNGDDANAGDSHSCEEPHNGKHDVGGREGTGDGKESRREIGHHQHALPAKSEEDKVVEN